MSTTPASGAPSVPERHGAGSGAPRPPESLPVRRAARRPHDGHRGEQWLTVVLTDSRQRDLGSGPHIRAGRTVRDAAVRPADAPAAGIGLIPAGPAQAADEQAAASPEVHGARPDLTSGPALVAVEPVSHRPCRARARCSG